MKRFDILKREQLIHQSYLVEASAGTGKTFAIENLVVRLLIESPALNIKKILVVTFTNAAARELKERIRATIEKTYLSLLLSSSNENEPDFLQAIREQGTAALNEAKRNLKQAQTEIDEAYITTIHGFCNRLLKEMQFDFEAVHFIAPSEKLLTPKDLIKIVRNFFRTGLNPELYSAGQIQIVLSAHKNEWDEFEKTLVYLLSQEEASSFTTASHFHILYEKWVKAMSAFTRKWEGKKIEEDLLSLAPCYREMCDKKKKVHSEIAEVITAFASLFDQDTWTTEDFDFMLTKGKNLLYKFDVSFLKQKGPTPASLNLHDDVFLKIITEHVLPYVEEAASYQNIIQRMVHACRLLLKKYADEEELFAYDDLLKKVEHLTLDSSFTHKLQNQFSAVIIDEFQDTDQRQWNIFKRSFLTEDRMQPPWVYFVGDPKQSIYAFRNADIYTYMEASKTLGSERQATLDTNFRSHTPLIEALNAFFSWGKDWLNLPQSKSLLEFHPVLPSTKVPVWSEDPSKGSLHFFQAHGSAGRGKKWPTEEMEREYLFPFIAQEIKRLNKNCKIGFGQWAVLVKDRYQGKRLKGYLEAHSIPVLNQRLSTLTESEVFENLKEWLWALYHGKDESLLKIAIAGQLVQCTHEDLKQLDETLQKASLFEEVLTLRKMWFSKGFSAFFQQFLQMKLFFMPDTLEVLLFRREEGAESYRELLQLGDLLSEEDVRLGYTPQRLLSYLDEVTELSSDEDERLQIAPSTQANAVKILTLHSSKGLEFDFVCALGVASRTPFTTTTSRKEMNETDLKEIDAEKMRQFYVALTRAKYRVYVPVAIQEDNSSEIALGTGSPMELFLDHAKVQDSGNALSEWVDKNKNISLSFEVIIPNNFEDFVLEMPENKTVSLLSPPKISSNHTFNPPILSFSSLHARSETLLYDDEEMDALEGIPHDPENIIKNVFTLPAGFETGIAIHSLLEKVRFENVQRVQTAQELLPFVLSCSLPPKLKGWEEVLSTMVLNAFKTPLRSDNEEFCLQDVPSSKIYREMEFLFPFEELPFKAKKEELDLVSKQGYLKGVIDLIFEWQGKYYLVDWKTNWLGSTHEAFDQKYLKETMHKQLYHWQKAIYQEALRRYIALVDKRPFSECFGGMFYLFLRGMDRSKKEGHGVFFIP